MTLMKPLWWTALLGIVVGWPPKAIANHACERMFTTRVEKPVDNAAMIATIRMGPFSTMVVTEPVYGCSLNPKREQKFARKDIPLTI